MQQTAPSNLHRAHIINYGENTGRVLLLTASPRPVEKACSLVILFISRVKSNYRAGAICSALVSGVKGEMSKIYFPREPPVPFKAPRRLSIYLFHALFAFNLVEIYIKTSAPIIYAAAQWMEECFFSGCINIKS